jgi:hypothetical protein
VRGISHGWQLQAANEIPAELISDFIRPAVRAIPPVMARQLGRCRVFLVENLGLPSIASRWTLTDTHLEIRLAAAARESHDIALELLECVGQALWETLAESQRKAYWMLLDDEIGAGVTGEIDEDALEEKNRLLSGPGSAASGRRLERYGAASFSGTAAEYVHSLWHDVTVRTGPGFLPADSLRRRLELVARWYPPGRGYRLYPASAPERRR